jgi:HD-GYP domain-containing protein (c-di-GMP phosphodiesterase class II)
MEESSVVRSLVVPEKPNKLLIPLSAHREGADPFVNLPIDAIPHDVNLPVDLHIVFQQRLLLFRQSGDMLAKSRAVDLTKRGVTSLYVRERELEKMLSVLQDQVELHSGNIVSESFSIRALILTYNRFLEASKALTLSHYKSLEKLAARLAKAVLNNRKHAGALLVKYDEPSLYLVNHTVNVAIYSLVIGMKQNIPDRDLPLLALASLLHNVGYLCMDSSTLYKARDLTPEERENLNNHTILGAKLLETLGAPREIIITALQHHESENGEGYPRGAMGRDIHPFSKICSIADVYDALTSVRPHRTSKLSPTDAIREMIQTDRYKFDPRIFFGQKI